VDLAALEAGLISGQRAVLARAITLVESKRSDHETMARELLTRIMAHTGNAQRVGITGVPGVGKSTTIEALGLMLCERGHRVAVLAVDPTSARSGGSILGDKTRMGGLAAHSGAFIRPSPAGETLGGVARRTREAMLLCEAAGFDVVIVETVGVGQSETLVAEMVDMFLVLMLPNAGDELQGIKKGLIELADLMVINKADLDPAAAQRAQRTYAEALHILAPMSPHWSPSVLIASGLEGEGLSEVWAAVERHGQVLGDSGERAQRRAEQQVRWMKSLISEHLLTAFANSREVREALPALEAAVAEGRIPASVAADQITKLALGVNADAHDS